MSNNNEDNKVVLIGEMGVGKTCIIEQFISNDFNQDQDSTITAQFCKKDFEFPRKNHFGYMGYSRTRKV